MTSIPLFPSERQKSEESNICQRSSCFLSPSPRCVFLYLEKYLSCCFHALTGSCHLKFENSERKGTSMSVWESAWDKDRREKKSLDISPEEASLRNELPLTECACERMSMRMHEVSIFMSYALSLMNSVNMLACICICVGSTSESTLANRYDKCKTCWGGENHQGT